MTTAYTNIAEYAIKGLVKGGVNPIDLFRGLRNSLCHGNLFSEADLEGDFGVQDEHLDSLITRVDGCIEDLIKMELN